MKNTTHQDTYTISIHTEDLNGRMVYVGTVSGRNTSSFGFTEEEALAMTIEALEGVLESEAIMRQERQMKEALASLTKIAINTYSLSIPQYATDLHVRGSRKNSEKTLMAA